MFDFLWFHIFDSTSSAYGVPQRAPHAMCAHYIVLVHGTIDSPKWGWVQVGNRFEEVLMTNHARHA